MMEHELCQLSNICLNTFFIKNRNIKIKYRTKKNIDILIVEFKKL